MFETAELGNKISKKVYRDSVVTLREELLELQAQLLKGKRSQVIVVFGGVDAAGKGETANVLNSWMDPRWLINRAFDEPVDVEKERPPFWRYWLALPPRGRIGIFLSSWYSPSFLDRVYEVIDRDTYDKRLERIASFESALVDDGATIVKFWLHLSKDAQKTRLTELEKDPLTRARVTERDWKHWKMYERFLSAAERLIERTSTGKSPWSIVEGLDPGYRNLSIGNEIRDTLRRRLEQNELELRLKMELRVSPGSSEDPSGEEPLAQAGDPDPDPEQALGTQGLEAGAGDAQEPPGGLSRLTILNGLDMSQTLDKNEYKDEIKVHQATLHKLHLAAREQGISTILVLEGPDAAGKGGAIRRVTACLDARNYQVYGFSAPTDEEAAQHYLWRFWRHLSRAGRITVFDRSWYGRVLVERVEGFAAEDEWRRAYAEINDFEQQLTEHGIVLSKFWIHITKEEQLERFVSREKTPYKRWKLTKEDWRNRERWEDYERAVHDMVEATSTRGSVWTLVEGNDKRFARVKVLQTLCEQIERALDAKKAA